MLFFVNIGCKQKQKKNKVNINNLKKNQAKK